MFDSILPLNFIVIVLLLSFISIVSTNIVMRFITLAQGAYSRFGLKDQQASVDTADEPPRKWLEVITPSKRSYEVSVGNVLHEKQLKIKVEHD